MEIKITLNSRSIQEEFDKGRLEVIARILNVDLGFGVDEENKGEVWDANGVTIGRWEVKE